MFSRKSFIAFFTTVLIIMVCVTAHSGTAVYSWQDGDGVTTFTDDASRAPAGARIKVIEATPNDSYQTLAQSSSIKRHPIATLRLLNGDYPNGEPRPGDLIKTVQ